MKPALIQLSEEREYDVQQLSRERDHLIQGKRVASTGGIRSGGREKFIVSHCQKNVIKEFGKYEQSNPRRCELRV